MPSYLFESFDRIERQRSSRHGDRYLEDPEKVFVRSAPRVERRLYGDGPRYEERRPHRSHRSTGPEIVLEEPPVPEREKREKKLYGSTVYQYTDHEVRTVKSRPSRSDEKPPSKEYVDAFVKKLGGSHFQGTIIENPATPDKSDVRWKLKPVTVPKALATGEVSIGEYRNGNKFFFRKSTKRGKKPPTAKPASDSSSSSS